VFFGISIQLQNSFPAFIHFFSKHLMNAAWVLDAVPHALDEE
jgi:hypothetical protein